MARANKTPPPPPPPILPSRVEFVLVNRDERRVEPRTPSVRFKMRHKDLDVEIEGPAGNSEINDLIHRARHALEALANKSQQEARLAEEQRIRLPPRASKDGPS